MTTFPSIPTIVPEGIHGVAAVEHFEVDRNAAMLTTIRRGEFVPPGTYARLRVKGQLMMSDTPMERKTNAEFVRKAHGNVLVAGLGLGLILHPILAKEDVTSVTVVEKYEDVIALIGPTVQHPKLAIVQGDIYTWKPAKGTKYDTIYFDVWAEQSTDTLKDMAKLHLRFNKHKVKGGWMESWRREELQAQKRRGGYW